MGAGVKRTVRGARHRPMGEINVTPFVDVMLVLLIVFMITAPLLTVGVEVDLPKTKARQINADAAPLVVSIKPMALCICKRLRSIARYWSRGCSGVWCKS